MGRNSRWLIILPAICFALFAKSAKADVLGNWTASQSCIHGSVEVINNSIILHGPDGCSGPNWVKIETTIPANVDTVDFTWAYQTNDGWWYDPPQYGVNGVYTLLTQQNNATGTKSVPVQEGDVFTFRQYSTDSCCQPGNLTISNLSLWEFTTTSTTSTTTTTTTVPETTVPATVLTTTTVQETTTSSVPQTTLPISVPTTTVVPETSTSTTPPTTVQITVPTPVTVAPVPLTTTTVPETTTTSTTSTTVLETTTSTTVKPQVKITTTTSAPVKTTDPIQSSLATMPEQTLSSPPVLQSTLTSSIPPLPLEETLQDISTKSNEEVAALAADPTVLATVSSQEASQIFAALDVEELSDGQINVLIAAVQDAPTEVRQAFEDKIDIFKSGLDNYVPVGSTIPVGTRRTLVAITAGITLAAAGVRIKDQ